MNTNSGCDTGRRNDIDPILVINNGAMNDVGWKRRSKIKTRYNSLHKTLGRNQKGMILSLNRAKLID